jgi:hypothetical protein
MGISGVEARMKHSVDDRTMVQCCPRCLSGRPLQAAELDNGQRIARCPCGWVGLLEQLRLVPLWWLKFKASRDSA